MGRGEMLVDPALDGHDERARSRTKVHVTPGKHAHPSCTDSSNHFVTREHGAHQLGKLELAE